MHMRTKELRQEVGQRLQEIRGRRDQRTFAEAVDSVQQTISKYERGEIPRSWLFLARLAEAEGIDLNRLLTGRAVARSANGDGNGWGSRITEERAEPAGAPV
jgi:transcriptional regulator with XRE-family HTH domain